MFRLKLINTVLNNFQSFDVVGRGSETQLQMYRDPQLQMGEKLNYSTFTLTLRRHADSDI